jgi:protein ImuB
MVPDGSMRIACLHVPDFPLATVLRTQPELRDTPLAVTVTPGPRAPVVAVSPLAARHGVRVGINVAQAMAIDAALVVRQASADARQAAQAALCEAAESFSPRVEDAAAGLAYLDLDGLGTLFESEARLANELARRAAQLGLETAQVGVAGSKVAARLAAQQAGGVTVIPPGEEWSFLAPLPVHLLEPGVALAARLRRWGLTSIGALAALPARSIGARLGLEGVQLVRRARGEDDQPLVPRVARLHVEEGVDLDFGIDTLEPLCFVLRRLLERLTPRLVVRGLICGDLRLSLHLVTRGRDERTVTVAAPSNDVKALLTLVRLHLEAQPPPAAIEAVRVQAVPERLRAAQLDLFRPNGPAPAQLAVTLARLTALCGTDRVGAPAVVDSHRLDAYGMVPFEPVPAPVRSAPAAAVGGAVTLALRALRPPHAVEVFCERDRPEFVRGADFAGRVVQAAGPWRVQSDWWNERATVRDYYDIQLSDGGVYRLYCERGREWFLDAVYD